MEIRLKYINQDSFYGSDYFIKRVGYEEKWDRVKRLGDTYYENELLERSVTEKYGSNLKIGKVENTAGAIGATGSGKLSIDEYIGHNLENKDETKGGSLSLSPNSNVISGVGINYTNKDLESVTKNTVIGNVEIGKSSGDEINKDLASMTEITEDRDFKTNDEEGLESLGRPANEYVKKKFGEDNNSKIKLTTDGIDLSNADVGEKVGDVNTQDDRNSGYAEILPSQQRDPWLNKMNFKLLRLRKNTDEFVEETLISSFYLHMRAYSILSDSGETIRDFTLGALKAGGEDLSLNTYKIPKRFQYNTLAYKNGELFGHFTMSVIGILGTIIGSGMEGIGTAAAPVIGGSSVILIGEGILTKTYAAGVGATASTNFAKTSLEKKAMKSEGSSSSSSKTETYDKKEKDEKLKKIELKPKEKRPTYRESEKDVYDFLDEKYKDNENITVQEQASFKGGQEAKHYGEKGSVRPDDTVIIKTETKNGTVISRESYEVKNYKIENYNNMTSKIGEQAKVRLKELPEGTVQKVVIDTRGQNLTTEIEAKTINDIVKKSNGIINAENIFFIK